MPKSLLERLEKDAKRHRAPQSEILPPWAREKTVLTPESKSKKPRKKSKKKK